MSLNPKSADVGGDRRLHTLRERWSHKDYRSIFWSEELQTWMVFEPKLVCSILTSKDCRVGLSVATINLMETRFNLDLCSVRRATAAMPVAHEGETHANIRRAMAMRLRANTDAALAIFTRCLEAGLDEPVRSRRAFDFNKLVLAPATASMMSVICGFDVEPADTAPAASQMLDRSLGLQRRKIINDRIRELYDRAEPVGGDQADLMVAMAILGFDTLQATLSENILSVLRRNEGQRLDRVNWPDEIKETGAPFIERTAITSMIVAGIEIRSGDNIRLFLDDIGPDGRESSDLFFGKGPHSCIGRSLSQNVWDSIVALLRRQTCGLTVEQAIYRSPDFMFRFTHSIIVRAHDADESVS